MNLISEENYPEAMRREVLPCLAAHGGRESFERNGRICYERYRCAFPKGVVVIVHGFTESAEKFREMSYYFLRNDFQVYAMDVRGHGRSVRETKDLYRVHAEHWTDYVKDLLFLARKIAARENPGLPLFLYAHSMGGGIGAAALEAAPELFARAVLTSPMIRPATGALPFAAARAVAVLTRAAGRGQEYVPGHKGYDGTETFQESVAASRARFDYYHGLQEADPYLQTSGATYGWLAEAAALSSFVLKKKNCARIRTRILLFQAEQEHSVMPAAQELFAKRAHGVTLAPVPGAKHEIYRSPNPVLGPYVERILEFFGEATPGESDRREG